MRKIAGTRVGLTAMVLCCIQLGGQVKADTLLVPDEYGTIQAAITAAVDGDIVEIADGTYTGDGNRVLDYAGKAITVRSASGDPTLCVLDVERRTLAAAFFDDGEGRDAVLEGLTIRAANNFSSGGGGAIHISASSPTIRNCIIENCGSSAGGAVYCGLGAAPLLENVTITDCRATNTGGGVHCDVGTAPLFEEVTITSCEASSGGGFYCDGAFAEFRACVFELNLADSGSSGWGGGGDARDGVLVMEGCRFSQNTASINSDVNGWGGGLYTNAQIELRGCLFEYNATVRAGGGLCVRQGGVVADCQFVGNSVDRSGGGLYHDGDDLIVVNCRFLENTAAGGGGASCYETTAEFVNCSFIANEAFGVYVNGIDGASDVVLANCTFAENTGNDTYGGAIAVNLDTDISTCVVNNCLVWNGPVPLHTYNGSIQCTYSDIEGGTGEPWFGMGCIEVDPAFVDADNGDYRLAAGSPCIDAGDNTAVPADDLDLDGDGDLVEPLPFDLDGAARFVDDPDTVDTGFGAPPLVDMGAHEFQVSACAGDLDGDGDTDQADLGVLLAAYGIDDGGDLDGDGETDQADLGALLGDYGCGG